jgi:hypothetical protein
VVVRSGDHEVEVTTYRVEADYADHRHPSAVAFTDSLHGLIERIPVCTATGSVISACATAPCSSAPRSSGRDDELVGDRVT